VAGGYRCPQFFDLLPGLGLTGMQLQGMACVVWLPGPDLTILTDKTGRVFLRCAHPELALVRNRQCFR